MHFTSPSPPAPSFSLTLSRSSSSSSFSFPFTNPCLFPVYNLQHTIPWAEMHARNGDKKVMIQARLCWQSFLPAWRIQSIRFLRGERGSGLLTPFRLSPAAAHACLFLLLVFGCQDVLVSHNYTSRFIDFCVRLHSSSIIKAQYWLQWDYTFTCSLLSLLCVSCSGQGHTM